MKSQRELSAHLCVCLWSQFVVKVSKVLNMLTELTSGRNKTNVNKLKLYSQRQLLRHTPGPNQGYRTAPVTDRLHIYCINAIFIKAFTIKGETCNGHRTINVQLQGTAVSLRWTCPVCCQRLTDINIKVPLLRRTLCPLLVDTVGCFHSASCAGQDSPSFVGKKNYKTEGKRNWLGILPPDLGYRLKLAEVVRFTPWSRWVIVSSGSGQPDSAAFGSSSEIPFTALGYKNTTRRISAG